MSNRRLRTSIPPHPLGPHCPYPSPSPSTLSILLALSLFVSVTFPAVAQTAVEPESSPDPVTSPDFDRWYLIEMQQQHAGWMHESQATDPATRNITTAQEMQITISRNGKRVKMRLAGRFVESPDHQPISFWTLEQLGSQPHEITYTFNAQNITVQKKGTPPTTIPRSSTPYLTPAQTRTALIEKLKTNDDQFKLTSFDPLAGITPVVIQYTILKHNTTALERNKNIPATQWSFRQDDQPEAEAIEFVDENAQLLRSTSSFGSLEMIIILSDQNTAQKPGQAPELLTTTFIKPDRTIRNPRGARQATFELTVTKGTFPDLPTTASQTVQPVVDANQDSRRITIDLNQNHPATLAELDNIANYLKPSPYINADSDAVLALLARGTKKRRNESPPNEDPAVAKRHAENLRAFTFRYIKKKDLGVGFASAEEVAKTRNGDCTEHAVLLTALLRADGIPARIASGLIYAESFAGKRNIFGYHMWSQALIDNKWVNLDATLRGKPFDATHITIQTTALNNDSITNALATTATLFGRLQIKVINVDYK